jgi:hypothetical protein
VSFYELAFKVLVDQAMPFGSHRNFLTPGKAGVSVQDELNPNERIALVNCLRAEFDEEQKQVPAWLREVACTKNQSLAEPHATGAAVDGHAAPPALATPPLQAIPGHDATGALPGGH